MKASRILTLATTALALILFQGMALADFSFDLDSPTLEADGVVGTMFEFHNTLANTGTTDDTYHVSIVKNIPAGWIATMCSGTSCYPEFITEIDLPILAGADTNLDIDITPNSYGQGSVTITVSSLGDPLLSVERTFALSTLDFEFNASDQGAVEAVGDFHAFHTTITNNSGVDDNYTVTMVKNAPETWISTLCEGDQCYPAFITEINVALTAGNQTNLDVDITAGDLGDGSVTITVASVNNPAQSVTKDFTVVTPGLDVLLVAGDNGMGNDAWYLDALAGSGKTVGTWKRQEMGILSNADLDGFAAVVWEAGTVDGGLTMDDLAGLAYYVQHSGSLFLSGQNLAFNYCNPASSHYTIGTRSWFNTILKTDYSAPEGAGDFAAGIDGDLVADGLFFNLYGGDGAGNNSTMDALSVVSGGFASIEYGSGNVAATRAFYGSGKTFFFGFGFEGIDTTANRDALMAQAMQWFDGALVPVGEVVAPLMASIPYATPNPFNPQTSIRFEVGGTSRVPAEVIIYNLKGQAVRNLFQGSVSPGPQSLVWNGRGNDGRHLATGIYMARVMIADQSKTVKMTLVK